MAAVTITLANGDEIEVGGLAPEDATPQMARLLAVQQGFITLEDIGETTDNPAADLGFFEAMMIQAGKVTSTIPDRVSAIGGDDAALGRVKDVEALLAPVAEERPIASLLGESLPGLAIPGGLTAQIAIGAAEGALLDPENPGQGALLGAGGALVGDRIGRAVSRGASQVGQKVGARIPDRVTDLIDSQFAGLRSRIGARQRLNAQGINLTGRQRGAPQLLEAAIETAPLGARFARAPANQQQKIVNKQLAQALGVDASELTDDVLGRAANNIGEKFNRVGERMEPQFIPEAQADVMREYGLLTREAEETLTETGFLTGPELMGARSDATTKLRSAGSVREMADMNRVIDGIDVQIATALPDTADRALYQEARQQWKLLKTAEKGSAISDAGNVNMRQMRRNIDREFRGFSRGEVIGGPGEQFGETIRDLSVLPRALQSSGTAERAGAASVFKEPGQLVKSPLTLFGISSGAQGGEGVGSLVGRAFGNQQNDEESISQSIIDQTINQIFPVPSQ